MNREAANKWGHPAVTRRTAIQAGAIGLLGMGTSHLNALKAADSPDGSRPVGTAKTCIYIFLSGGLSQHESFDLKPQAPSGIRGEFQPISTKTPGVQISEHLPGLAKRGEMWSVVRSMTHPTNGHTLGHYFMLTGRSVKSPAFRGDRKPRPGDWPSIASIVGDTVTAPRNNLPPSIVLPERLVHWSGGVIPGAFGGIMGAKRDPFFIEASPYGNPFWRGAYPEYTFPNHAKAPPSSKDDRVYRAPNLKLANGLSSRRLDKRLNLLDAIDQQRRDLERSARVRQYDRDQQSAVSMLADPKVRHAFDVTKADEKTQERYGANSFGWSLLMAYRLTQAGVPLIQVNLGNNETWDSHGDIFPRLKNKLFPPTDRALCALLDDLKATGMLDSTLIVMAGEFGRTPKLSSLNKHYNGAGRDHWGAVQSVFFAGGGIQGGRVIGSSDAIGAYPASSPQLPENLAATIYQSLGIPSTAAWKDDLNRPHQIYHGEPIHGLF